MYKIQVLLFFWCLFCCLFLGTQAQDIQTFYLADNGGTTSCSSPEEACGSLIDVIPLIDNFEVDQVIVNVFPGFYNESNTNLVFPEVELVTIQKYDPNDDGGVVTFLGTNSEISIYSSVTIKDITFEQYNNFLTINSPTSESSIQLIHTTFVDISVLLTNIDKVSVILSDISMSTTDYTAKNYKLSLITPHDYLKSYPGSFSITGCSFNNLKYGDMIIWIESESIEIIDTDFTSSGRLGMSSTSGLIRGCSFYSPEGFNNISGYGGTKTSLYLEGVWNLDNINMGGYTEFPYLVDYWDSLSITIINSTPGRFTIRTTSMIAENCNFEGNISLQNGATISNSSLQKTGFENPQIYGQGQFINCTIYTFDVHGLWNFDKVQGSYINANLYSGSSLCPSSLYSVNISNSEFTRSEVTIKCTGTVNVFNSNFTECYSEDSGGAIYIIDATKVDIIDSYFNSNTAVSLGGALYVKSDWSQTMKVNLTGSTFYENNANMGGAIACTGKVSIQNPDDAIFTSNTARYSNSETSNIYCPVESDNIQASNSNSNDDTSLLWLWIVLGCFGIIFLILIIIVIIVITVVAAKYAKKYLKKNEFDIDIDIENEPY